MNKCLADNIRSWVQSGGTLISEALFGAYQAENNLHSIKTPGYGFDEVFGLNGWITETENQLIGIDYTAADGRLINAGGIYFKETFIPGTGRTLATFDTGEPAVVINNYGNGKAVYIGTLLGAAYDFKRDENIEAILTDMAAMACIRPNASVNRPNIRIDFLTQGTDSILIVNNEGSYAGNIVISINTDLQVAKFRCLESGEDFVTVPVQDAVMFTLNIGQQEVRIFQGL